VVGLAELVVSNNPSAVLTTYSLGSCVSVVIYDPVVRVGGLLHAMLPDSALDPIKAKAQPGMFVDTGVRALLQAASQFQADRRRLRIYVAGGARILEDQSLFNIGERNLTACGEILRRESLRVSAEEVGGQANRTVGLAIDTGCITLKVSGVATEVALS
jgi:chemotaxis protein CheD